MAETYSKYVKDKLAAISFVTVGELYYGAEKGRWGEPKRLRLEATIRNFVVVPYDHVIARFYGRIVNECRAQGHDIKCADAWIAACAVRHGIPLVTHNARHFLAVPGLAVITEAPGAFAPDRF